MFERTALASERSRRGPRLLMILVWWLTRASRVASREGAAACASGPLGAGRGGRRLLRAGELPSEGEDVLCDLALAVADDEGHAAVHGQDERAAGGDDRVRDLAPEARLDIGRLDAARAVVAVGHELQLVVVVAELLGDLHEDADVLEARDLEGHEGEDHAGGGGHGDDPAAAPRPRGGGAVRVTL